MTPFILEPVCTLSQADSLHAALAEHIAGHAGEGLVIDATAVEEADVSLAQILVSAGQTAAARGAALSLRPSPAVSALLARAGLGGWARAVGA